MGEVRRTLIPQFSLRLILGIVSVLAVAAAVVSLAGRGWAWAAGVSIGLLAIAVAFAVYAVLFGVAWLFSLVIGAGQSKAGSSTTKTLLGALFVLFNLCALEAHVALAASGGSITLPVLSGKQTNKTGLELTLNTVWVDSYGYRPVRVDVRSIAGPVIADRVLTIRFRPRIGYTQENSVAVTQQIELPAGSTSTKGTISVPQEATWGSFEMDVFENGQYVEQLSIGPNAGWTSWSGTDQGDRSLPVILQIDNADRSQPVKILIGGDSPEELIVEQKSGVVVGDLPTQWIDYSGADIVLCSQAELQAIVEQFPAQWGAMHNWLRNGGNLVVYGAGKNWERVADVEKMVGFTGQDAKVGADTNDAAKRGWSLPEKKLRSKELIKEPSESTQSTAVADVASLSETPFLTRPCRLGMVTVVRADEKFDGSAFPWAWLFNTIGPERWQWFQRCGLSLSRQNGDFWSFLIPGVGLAPVTQFQVFITLFMVVIGPVNYFVLRRWGKLNLMVLTVPAGALLVTFGLIAMALLADGLGVRVRARSFTTIDQRNGEATCWARLSYYAGLAPGGGLNFSGETVVLPLEAEPENTAERHALRVVDWERNNLSDSASPLEQHLTEGWLPARTPTEFVTSRIGKTKAHLEIKPAETNQSPQVVNQLESRILQLVLIDENGGCFAADNVAAGASAALKKKNRSMRRSSRLAR